VTAPAGEHAAETLPSIEEVEPLLPALHDLLLPAPVGGRRPIEPTLAALEALIARCGHTRPGSIVDDLRPVLPGVRHEVVLDARAAFDGDPACTSETEAALCYPGVGGLAIHRLAHELFRRDVPLVPRLLSECSHRQTGIDIHPGARIGHSVFIDHGTGVVIGGTARIGDHCRIYQGVSLGTSSVRRGMDPRAKRHPTLEDHVTVYAGATILGGDTVIGAGCVIGGGVFLTESVPPGHIVTNPRPVIELRENPVRPPLSFAI
jgi:serine O-acetyltransferase